MIRAALLALWTLIAPQWSWGILTLAGPPPRRSVFGRYRTGEGRYFVAELATDGSFAEGSYPAIEVLHEERLDEAAVRHAAIHAWAPRWGAGCDRFRASLIDRSLCHVCGRDTGSHARRRQPAGERQLQRWEAGMRALRGLAPDAPVCCGRVFALTVNGKATELGCGRCGRVVPIGETTWRLPVGVLPIPRERFHAARGAS